MFLIKNIFYFTRSLFPNLLIINNEIILNKVQLISQQTFSFSAYLNSTCFTIISLRFLRLFVTPEI